MIEMSNKQQVSKELKVIAKNMRVCVRLMMTKASLRTEIVTGK